MGYRIVDQTSKGSAIGAYGTARGPRLNVPLLALVAGSLALVAGLVFFLFRMTVPMPAHTVLLVAARPAALNTYVNRPSLLRDLPASWRAVLDTNSHFPALFGVALDNNRRPHAFAIVPKTTLLGDPPNLQRTSFGFMALVASQELSLDTQPLGDLPLSVTKTFGADAVFALRGDLLEAWAFDVPFAEDTDTIVRGEWRDGMGHLDVRDVGATAADDIDASLFSIVGGTDGARRTIVAGLLSQGVDLRDAEVLPTATALSVSPLGNRALSLMWPDTLSDTDRAMLPEDGIFSDNNLVTFLETATTTAEEEAPTLPASDCPGTPHFILEGNLLQETLLSLGLSESWQDAIRSFRIHEQSRQVFACIWG